MNKIKGRPLGVCFLLIIAWTAGRVGMAGDGDITRPAIQQNDALPDMTQMYSRITHHPPAAILLASAISYHAIHRSIAQTKSAPKTPKTRRILSSSPNTKNHFIPDGNAVIGKDTIVFAAPPRNPQPAPISPAPPALLLSTNKSGPQNRLKFYTYSFWRARAPGSSDSPGAQYGGSQSGVIATYRLDSASRSEWALLMRAAVAPGRIADQEFAAGLRWQPPLPLPLSISAERRYRSKSKDQFAVYAATSVDDVPLANGLNGRGFVQGGVIPDKKPNVFYDAGLRIEHDIVRFSSGEIAVGAGAWAGGQRAVSRLDIGPTISSVLPVGASRITVSADWRVRIGGNARPGNGPALTISAGF